MIYFKKELVSNPLRYSDGAAVPFEVFAGNVGGLVLDEENEEQKKRIDDLNKIAGTRGVVKISKDKYEELKKKLPSKKPLDQLKGLRLHDPEQIAYPGKKPVIAATAPAGAAPAAVASHVPVVAAPEKSNLPFKPRVGRPKKIGA